MRRSRYKYFPNVEYAKQLLDGNVYCQTAAYFRDYEDRAAQQIIGDEYEGARLYRPLSGLKIKNLTRGIQGNLQWGMECLIKADEIFIFCASFSFDDLLKKEFGAVACVEIFNPREFIARWLKALPEEAQKGGKHVARKVDYYRPEDVPGNVSALPHLIVTSKLKRFLYQEEYRFAYTLTDAFVFQNCTYSLVNRRSRPAAKPDEHHHQTLHLGDLRDICKLQEFSPNL